MGTRKPIAMLREAPVRNMAFFAVFKAQDGIKVSCWGVRAGVGSRKGSFQRYERGIAPPVTRGGSSEPVLGFM